MQVASLAFLPGAALTEASTGVDVDTIDIQGYSQRLAAFNTLVLQKVYSQINYPTRAVRRGLEGRVELDVTMGENGQLVEIVVARSSGYKILDRAAVKAADKGLASMDPAHIDPVAIAEFGGRDEQVVVPVPVQFMLTE